LSITPKNWDTFQHYKDRSPTWIKLHKGLLDDYAFSCLPVASRALAPLLWLLASEYDAGKITASVEEMAFRFRMSETEFTTALNPLIEAGFFLSASKSLARRKRDASLEKEREKQEEKEGEGARSVKKDRRRATQIPDDRKPNYDLSLKANLTQAETDRVFAKFENPAKPNGRTCIDWDAAEQNWYFKSAEFIGRKPPPGPSTLPQKIFVREGTPAWSAWTAHLGREPQKNKDFGWYFDTEFPPVELQREAAE
jgi:hypothetical protein